jgi:hypothetical protein
MEPLADGHGLAGFLDVGLPPLRGGQISSPQPGPLQARGPAVCPPRVRIPKYAPKLIAFPAYQQVKLHGGVFCKTVGSRTLSSTELG